MKSDPELWVQVRMDDGNGQGVEDYLTMIDLLGQTRIQKEFLVTGWDAVCLEMWRTRFIIEMPNSCGKALIVELDKFRENLLRQRCFEIYRDIVSKKPTLVVRL